MKTKYPDKQRKSRHKQRMEFKREISHLDSETQQALRELTGLEGPDLLLKRLTILAQNLEAEPDDD